MIATVSSICIHFSHHSLQAGKAVFYSVKGKKKNADTFSGKEVNAMLKVLFVCCAGMSTSLLVEKVKLAANEKGVDLDVRALGEADAKKDLTQADVLLLGPQVRYLESSFRKALDGTATGLAVVDMLAYGRLDGEKVLQQILSMRQADGSHVITASAPQSHE